MLDAPIDLLEQERNVRKAVDANIRALFPITRARQELHLKDLSISNDLDVNDLEGQKDAKLKRREWAENIHGTFELVDRQTGKVIDRSKVLLGKLPKLTPRAGYIVDGNEYSILNQLRLRPGVYTAKDNTGKYIGLFNLARGRKFTRRMSLELNPKTKVYTLSLDNSNFSLYPILRALGITDQQIISTLTKDVFNANNVTNPEREIVRFYQFISGNKTDDLQVAISGIRERLQETSLEGGTTDITLGKSFEKVDGELLLRTADKLLRVNKGLAEEDDRNALYFKSFFGIEHNLQEALGKRKFTIRNSIAQKVDQKGKINEIMANQKIGPEISAFFNRGELKDLPQQNNPIAMLEPFTRVTLFGPGGLGTPHAVTPEMATLQPSFLGFMDPMMTPDGKEVGTRFYLASNLEKKGNDLFIPVRNLKTREIERFSPHKVFSTPIGFPEETESTTKSRRVAFKGEIHEVERNLVSYEFTDPRGLYNIVSNAIPFLNSTYGVRANVATKQLTQAMALRGREAPLVRAEADQGKGVDDVMHLIVTPRSPEDGTVTAIKGNVITIKGKSGETHKVQIYKDFPLNGDAYIDSTPTVSVGQKVKAGQYLADSVFTKDGTMAIGSNLRVAYLPDQRGGNFEDGIVISESAAQKLASLHLRKFSVDMHRTKGVLSLDQFATHMPNVVQKIDTKKYNSDGTIKPGTVVHEGDPLVLYMEETELSPTEIALGEFSKKLRRIYSDRSLHYDHVFPGTVQNVQKGTTFIDVYVKTEEPAVVGDKLTLRAGAKGIVSRVLPDSEMPHTTDGAPVEVLMTPFAVPTRINPSQLLEAAAGKAAKALGRPFVIRNFGDKSNLDTVRKFIAEAGVKEKEELIDPASGKSLGDIFIGNSYFLKLNHPVFKKFSARGYREVPYSAIDERPSKTSGANPEAIDALTFYGLIAHGARGFIRELANYRSQKNDEFWRAIELGTPLPPLKTPLATDKLAKTIQAAGIKIERRNDSLKLLPMTDKEIVKMSNGEVTEDKFVKAKNFQPEKNGFFDVDKTGGLLGEHWTHIKLTEPLPNPIFEQAIKVLLDLKPSEFDGLISGSLKLNDSGDLGPTGRYSGGSAIRKMLADLDISKELSKAQKELQVLVSSKGIASNAGRVNVLNRKIRYLQNLKENRISPADAYVQTVVPILPPKFRPLTPRQNNMTDVSPINYLYKDLLTTNNEFEAKKKTNLPDEFYREDRIGLYAALKAVSGMGDPVNKQSKQKDVVGIMTDLSGKEGPKGSYLHERLLSKRQDLSGRSTIIPGLDIPFDHIGIPEEMLITVYKPFIINRLIQLGYTYFDADDQIKKRTPLALDLMREIAKERPVAANRHPALHKFSIMGFKPIPISGSAIKLHPLTISGFNADYDGDEQISTVVFFVCNQNLDLLRLARSKFSEVQMTARMRVSVPALNGMTGFVSNLEDFPREGTYVEQGHIKYHSVPDGICVVAMDEKAGKPVLAQVSGWSVHIDREVEIINLRSGRQIISDDDPRAVYGLDVETMAWGRWRPADSIGKFVPICAEIDLGEPSITKIEAGSDKLCDVHLNYETGHWLGMMVGNGWVTYHNGEVNGEIAFAGENETQQQAFRDGLQLFFEAEQNISSIRRDVAGPGDLGATTKTHAFSREFARILSTWIGHGARYKHVPPFSFCAPKPFRLGLLAGLIDTDGSVSFNKSKGKPQFLMNFSSASIRLVQEIQFLARSLNLRSTITSSRTPRGEPYWVISFSTVDLRSVPIELLHARKSQLLSDFMNTPYEETPVEAKNDIVPIPFSLASVLQSVARVNGESSLYSSLSKAKACGSISRIGARRILKYVTNDIQNEYLTMWRALVENEAIMWDRVESYEKTGIKETGYDLTVPGYETFMSLDGTILSNTMGVWVPVTEEAKRDVLNMLPSKNLLGTSGQLMNMPTNEAQLGLYLLTREGKHNGTKFANVTEAKGAYRNKTMGLNDEIYIGGKKSTLGRYLVNEVLPEKYRRDDLVLSKPAAADLIRSMIRADPQHVPVVLDKLKDLGNEYSYLEGFTLGIEDIEVDKGKREAAIEKLEEEFLKTLPDDRPRVIAELAKQKTSEFRDSVKGKMERNPLWMMASTGAKGKWDQMAQTVFTPISAAGPDGSPMPFLIRSNYAHGLDPSEYYAMQFGGRVGIVGKALGTAKGGEINKETVATAINHVVTERDCRTQRGILSDVMDLDNVLGRRLASKVAGVGDRNDQITREMLAAAQKLGIRQLKIRSPITCEAPIGTCIYCAGTTEFGKDHRIGDNIGIVAAQAISEPLTQSILRSFHGGRGEKSGVVSEFDRISTLLFAPQDSKYASVLAAADGVVTKIVPGSAGGTFIHIGEKEYFARPGQRILVAVGQSIHKGDKLTDGIAHPRDVMALHGIDAARRSLVDQLDNIYRDGGMKVNRKHFETMASSMINWTQIVDPKGMSGYEPGDIVSYNQLEAEAKKMGLPATEKPVHSPIVKGMPQIPTLRKDWLNQAARREIRRALTEGAAQGWQTNLRSTNPLAGWMLGDVQPEPGEHGEY